MKLKHLTIGASMLALASCTDKQTSHLPLPSNQFEQHLLGVKGAVGNVVSELNIGWEETYEGKEHLKSLFEFGFRGEFRLYHVEGDNVVFTDKNTAIYNEDCCLEGQEEDILIPINDRDTFLTFCNGVNSSNMAVFDGKFYLGGKHFPEIDAASLRIVDDTYISDKNGVYTYGFRSSIDVDKVKLKHGDRVSDVPEIHKIPEADPKLFAYCRASDDYISYVSATTQLKFRDMQIKRSERDYCTDGKNVFFEGKKLDADAKTFRTSIDGYAHDENNLYRYGEKIPGFDVKKLRIIAPDNRAEYLTDGKVVVHKGVMLKGFNPLTFRITKFSSDTMDQISVDGSLTYIGTIPSDEYNPLHFKKENQYQNFNDLF